MFVRISEGLLLSLAAAAALSAQPAPTGVMRDAHALALGGVSLVRTARVATSDTERLHLTGGLETGAAWRGWGALALGMAGRGSDYDSLLLGGAASRRVMRGDRWSLLVFGGYGAYGERGTTGIERDSHGILFGTTARWRVGPISLAGVFSHLTGSYDEADVTAPFRFHVPRLALGVGF